MRIAIALLVLALAGCGADAEAEREAPAGTLEVWMELPGGPIYIEGSVPIVRVERPDGSLVFEDPAPVETLDKPVLERSLPAGEYVVDVIQRSCNGNCQYLDPPDEDSRCRTAAAVRAESRTAVTVRLRHDGRGRMDVRCSSA